MVSRGDYEHLRRRVARLDLQDEQLARDVDCMLSYLKEDPAGAAAKGGLVVERVLLAECERQTGKRVQKDSSIQQLRQDLKLPRNIIPLVDTVQRLRNSGAHAREETLTSAQAGAAAEAVVAILEWWANPRPGKAKPLPAPRGRVWVGVALGALISIGAVFAITLNPHDRHGETNDAIAETPTAPSNLIVGPERPRRSLPTEAPSVPLVKERIKVAAWNLSSLADEPGAGAVARTERDYERLREYATRLNADVIAVQEVEGEAGLRRVFPSERYEFHLSERDGERRTGVVVRRGLSLHRHPDVSALNTTGHLRHGTDVSVGLGSTEFRVLSVHLKAYCAKGDLDGSEDACRKLSGQLPPLSTWIRARIDEGTPFVVAGDFNRRFFDAGDEGWVRLSKDLPAALWSPTEKADIRCWGRYDAYIDHLVFDERSRRHVVEGSFAELSYDSEDQAHAERLSDHCPIAIELSARPSGKAAAAPTTRVRKKTAEARSTSTSVQPTQVRAPIKGNISSTSGKKLYHLPRCPDYAKVKISKPGERYFDSEAAARAAGFERAGNCR